MKVLLDITLIGATKASSFIAFVLLILLVNISMACPVVLEQGHYSGISKGHPYDEIESSAWAVEELSRVLSKDKVGSDREVLGAVVSDAAKTGIKATGQAHRLLGNKITRALNNHPTLTGAFDYSRTNSKYIYNDLDDATHKGYQTWHRQYDASGSKAILLRLLRSSISISTIFISNLG